MFKLIKMEAHGRDVHTEFLSELDCGRSSRLYNLLPRFAPACSDPLQGIDDRTPHRRRE
ncbi:hypothetical protein GCM10009682_31710 [Luedemannella flava]|uniref:Uncharacterized protein n=1 Tax=Luedemannella flava TaxID=349316 RepID=A0ABP4Y9Y4_9ACTN